jgi:probable F420-dependent oxidoreductase
MTEVRFGVALQNFTTSGEAPDVDRMIAYAIRAEALGYDSVWAWDHLLLGAREPFPVLDSLTVLTAIAVRTEKVRVGTGVLVLPLRNPVVLAKVTATLDRASHGRLTLGVAAGWYRREFDAAAVPHAERGSVFMRNLRLLYALWSGETLDAEEGPHRLHRVTMVPPPLQRPRPEVLIGGYVDRVLRRVARHSDGWLTYFYTAPSFARSWRRILELAEEAGRDPSSLTNVSQLPICVDGSYERADRRVRAFVASHFDIPAWSDCSPESAVRGTPEQCAEQLAEHLEAGVRRVVLVPTGYEVEQLEAIAKDVLPRLDRVRA